MINEKAFEKICLNVNAYLINEFDIKKKNHELFDEDLRCSLLYTYMGEDDEYEFQVYIDLKRIQIIKELSYSNTIKHYEYERYDDWNELSEITEDLEFEDLYWIRGNLSDIASIVEKIEN
ncbi:hypothetical protein [Mammaliicoccus vitulinus]|uniref:hypothetical protein n=1 Tax=Mammaliicoccus vitulinus TaxID=71237 RepID=UPI00248B4186|nr:hypothetical protein [Mammaliicoccus vitulinus]